MLAQNFLGHEVLGITEEEQSALIKVLGMLERGELTHVPDPVRFQAWSGNAFPKHFNMRNWNTLADCGTVCCIGGTAEWVGGFRSAHFQRIGGRQLAATLTLAHHPSGARNANVEQAASALRNYLTLGEPRWSEVLAAAE